MSNNGYSGNIQRRVNYQTRGHSSHSVNHPNNLPPHQYLHNRNNYSNGLGMTETRINSVNSHPSKNQLRDARLIRFQSAYDHDKELYKVKEKEKQHRKLEEKLNRYKGVGELGNKMCGSNIDREEKNIGTWKSRGEFQRQHEQQAQDQKLREQNELEESMEKLKIEREDEDKNDSPIGGRLGGKNMNIVRGEHPLLAKVVQVNKKLQDSE